LVVGSGILRRFIESCLKVNPSVGGVGTLLAEELRSDDAGNIPLFEDPAFALGK